MHQPPPPELEHSLRPSPSGREEPPPPNRQRKTSKILFESLGGTCQVKPEEKGLLGARSEEMEAEEPKAACVSSALEEVKIQKKPDAKGTETTSKQFPTEPKITQVLGLGASSLRASLANLLMSVLG
eukprot:scaffold19124_cov62-Phaeocystis_antarctica.AAC.6